MLHCLALPISLKKPSLALQNPAGIDDNEFSSKCIKTTIFLTADDIFSSEYIYLHRIKWPSFARRKLYHHSPKVVQMFKVQRFCTLNTPMITGLDKISQDCCHCKQNINRSRDNRNQTEICCI